MSFNVAVTGATGNMGKETLNFLCRLDAVDKVYFLCLPGEVKKGKKLQKQHAPKAVMVVGNTANIQDCRKLVADVSYVIHMAAVIPPKSDQRPELSDQANFWGTKAMVDAVLELENQPKFVHISTVALYGNRNHLHPYGRVGDPLLPSAYDPYAMSKLEGERYVLEAGLKTWAVIRQTAMLHNRMLTDNLSDGLMFHTCYNAPLEWVTARDSGRLMGNIVDFDARGEVDCFWNKVYNLGGPAANRITGYEVFDGGFKIIGGSTEKFMKPNWNAMRNFHGVWFWDGHVLDDLFHYQQESVDDYWKEILNNHKYYKIAKIIPPKVISGLAIKPLLKDKNAPMRWIRNNDEGRKSAYFGTGENDCALSKKWQDFPLLCKGQLPNGETVDYQALRDPKNAVLLSHGYDESKPDSELDIDDLRKAAAFRGGELVSTSFQKGNLFQKLVWRCQDGHEFQLTAFSVLKAGHWCPECNKRYVWDYDRLSKGNQFYAQVWYDSHANDEDYTYWLDENFNAHFKRNK